MADARNSRQCAQTSAILAMLVNVNRDPKKQHLPLDYFDPYAKRTKKSPLEKVSIRMLKDVFVDRRLGSKRA